jgi:hypothetical protein
MKIDLSAYCHDIHSDFGEDGILYSLFRLIGHYKLPTYLNVSSHFTRKNGLLYLIRTFGFRNVTSTRVESTLESMKETPLRYPYVDLLRMTRCDGVEYWLIKALIERGVYPNVICCDVNLYEKSVSVPYVPLHKRADVLCDPNYRGASVSALCAFLCKKKYTFAGVSKHSVRAFFVRSDVLPRDVSFVAPVWDDFPSVRYARTHRWDLVSKKLWITIV